MIPAIFWHKETLGTVSIKYGKSDFKLVDDLWTKFDGQLQFAANVLKDTPKNREIVRKIQENFQALYELNDKTIREMYHLLNEREK